jgi:hypothetical protein
MKPPPDTKDFDTEKAFCEGCREVLRRQDNHEHCMDQCEQEHPQSLRSGRQEHSSLQQFHSSSQALCTIREKRTIEAKTLSTVQPQPFDSCNNPEIPPPSEVLVNIEPGNADYSRCTISLFIYRHEAVQRQIL